MRRSPTEACRSGSSAGHPSRPQIQARLSNCAIVRSPWRERLHPRTVLRRDLSSRVDRQLENKASASVVRKLRPDRAAVQLQDLSTDKQAEAHSTVVGIAVSLIKALENLVAS